MSLFQRFGDVAREDEAVLRRLLAGDGDEPERLWAAWSLALRRVGSAGGLVAQHVTREPAAGVRAHLALLLVAHGERAAAIALARHDPSATVRAAAYRSLARTAALQDDALNDLLAHALANERSAEVRAAILDGLQPDAPAFVCKRALVAVEDQDVDVRERAIDFALRYRTNARPFPEELRIRAARETEESLLTTLFDAWTRATAWPPSSARRRRGRRRNCSRSSPSPRVLEIASERFPSMTSSRLPRSGILASTSGSPSSTS
jgi:hypothetical protein